MIEQIDEKNRLVIDVVSSLSKCLKENTFAKLVLYNSVLYLAFNDKLTSDGRMTDTANHEKKSNVTIGGMEVEQDNGKLNNDKSYSFNFSFIFPFCFCYSFLFFFSPDFAEILGMICK